MFRPHGFQAFTVTASGIGRTTVFQDAEVFALFGLREEADAGSGRVR
ncbi:hypothetical protein [Kitasatospora sp. NPDC057015]